MNTSILIRFLVLVASFSVSQAGFAQQSQPSFGNGMRNCWADQNSIVIWTRTTQFPEMVKGPDFKSVQPKIAEKIKKSGENTRYVTDQLADEHQLNEMLGACPGIAGRVRLRYRRAKSPDKFLRTDWKVTEAISDFTAQWKLENLQPGTQYEVIAEACRIGDEKPASSCKGHFQTAPAAEQPHATKFCVTTCHDFLRRDDGEIGHQIYPSMTRLEPDFMVHAGDIEYYDKAKPYAWTIGLMRFKWQRLFSMPRNRKFYSNHTSYFIKDDHDTLKNDCWPGLKYGEVTFDEGVKLFNQEQFPSHPTRYKTVRWGNDLQFWILEGRDYRSPHKQPDGPNKSILGAQQKNWLKETLQKSDARFKLVFSPTPIVGPDRKNKKDNHANTIFAHEGEELRNFFATIDGIILFCGDRHWQYASVDPATKVWEFGCGPGSAKHQLGWKKGDVRDEHRFLRVAGGFLSGEVRSPDGETRSRLILRHRDVKGNAKSEFWFESKDKWGIKKQPSLPNSR